MSNEQDSQPRSDSAEDGASSAQLEPVPAAPPPQADFDVERGWTPGPPPLAGIATMLGRPPQSEEAADAGTSPEPIISADESLSQPPPASDAAPVQSLEPVGEEALAAEARRSSPTLVYAVEAAPAAVPSSPVESPIAPAIAESSAVIAAAQGLGEAIAVTGAEHRPSSIPPDAHGTGAQSLRRLAPPPKPKHRDSMRSYSTESEPDASVVIPAPATLPTIASMSGKASEPQPTPPALVNTEPEQPAATRSSAPPPARGSAPRIAVDETPLPPAGASSSILAMRIISIGSSSSSASSEGAPSSVEYPSAAPPAVAETVASSEPVQPAEVSSSPATNADVLEARVVDANVEAPRDATVGPVLEVAEVALEDALQLERDAEESSAQDSPLPAASLPQVAPDADSLSAQSFLLESEAEGTGEPEELPDEDVAPDSDSPQTVRRPPPRPPRRISLPADAPESAPPRVASTTDEPASSQDATQPLPERKQRLRKPWWEELFDEDFSRALPRLTDAQISREVDFIEESLSVAPGATVLDLGCGNGQHAVELAGRGYGVVGYDLSLHQLALAADIAQERSQKLNLLQGDMRELAFEETFDGIYCWNTTFGYFEEDKNAAVAQSVYQALKPGGMVLVDVCNRDFVAQDQPSSLWYEGDACVCMDDMNVDFITSRLKVKRSLILDDGRTKECTYSLRVYSLHELGRLLHDVGFKIIEASGHPGTPGVFHGQFSPKVIILAQRPEVAGEE